MCVSVNAVLLRAPTEHLQVRDALSLQGAGARADEQTGVPAVHSRCASSSLLPPPSSLLPPPHLIACSPLSPIARFHPSMLLSLYSYGLFSVYIHTRYTGTLHSSSMEIYSPTTHQCGLLRPKDGYPSGYSVILPHQNYYVFFRR